MLKAGASIEIATIIAQILGVAALLATAKGKSLASILSAGIGVVTGTSRGTILSYKANPYIGSYLVGVRNR